MNEHTSGDTAAEETSAAEVAARSTPLAVRHRPRRFADVVGQRAVRAALSASVRAAEPPRQLLLSGGSGLGKTTIARIFAAALLCEDPQGDGDSCGRCASCIAVWDTAEPHPDVIEMDAASNGGKDEIGALSQRVNLAPLRGRWKIFIVDEAHGITRAGADAFLKLLEEPPDHVIFVLATTEAHKMLATIRGRCVELGFTAPTTAELVAHVSAVAETEGWPLSEAVAEAVVDSVGDGLGVRGALSALGRIAGLAAAGVELDDSTVAELLGAAPRTAVAELVAAICGGELAVAYAETAALCERYPASEVRRVLVRQLRDLLVHADTDNAEIAARRLSAVAEVGDGIPWLEIGVARATVAALDTGAGLAELCARAEAAAVTLHGALSQMPTPAQPPAAPAREGLGGPTPVLPETGNATDTAPTDTASTDTAPGSTEAAGEHVTDEATQVAADAEAGSDAVTPATEPAGQPGEERATSALPADSTAPTAPPPPSPAAAPPATEPPPPEADGHDAPPHSDYDEPGDETSEAHPSEAHPWETDPWFADPRSSTTNPNGGSQPHPARTGTPMAPAKRAPAKKAPAKKKAAAKRKAPAKKAPARKAPAKRPAQEPKTSNAEVAHSSGTVDTQPGATSTPSPAASAASGQRRRTGSPASGAGIDTARLAAVVAARDELAARILAQCVVRSAGSELAVVVPVKLAEGLRARPELREVIDAAAVALGATKVTWKVQRAAS